ncbi:MAG: hypothetical protein JWR61_1313 [Ferruginibacter sp.]|nr:hypothetical protein [Ferruginibacter sp.]
MIDTSVCFCTNYDIKLMMEKLIELRTEEVKSNFSIDFSMTKTNNNLHPLCL